jgi:hypothetical protein
MKYNRLTILLSLLIVLSATLSLSGYQADSANRFWALPENYLQVADSICYASGDNGGGPPGNDMLTQVDFDLGVEIPIGSTGTNSLEAIAFQANTGILFGADADQLGTLNLGTGAFTPKPNTFGIGDGSLGPINLNDADGLTFDPSNGILYASDRRSGGTNVDLLFQADPDSGSHVENAFGPGVDYLVIQPDLGLYDIDDLAIDPVDGQMYGIANNSGSGDRLVKINKFTGVTIDVGSLGVNDMEGLTFDPTGQLLGTTGKDGPASTNNKLFRIDKTTAIANVATAKPLTVAYDYEGVDCLTSWAEVPTPTPTITETPIPTSTGTPIPMPTLTPTVPTAVKLLYFQVDSIQGLQVSLKWATASEVDNYGFRVYRSSVNGFESSDLIGIKPAVGGVGGAKYIYIDSVPGRGQWYYWLADVDTHGQETVHGPVSANVVGGINATGNLIFLPLVIQP